MRRLLGLLGRWLRPREAFQSTAEVEPEADLPPDAAPLPLPPPPPVVGSPEDYQLLQRVARTSEGGELFRALAPDGQVVYFRRRHIRDDPQEEQWQRAALEQARSLRHPFLIQTLAYWVGEGRAEIVTEWADGSLRDWLREYQGDGLPGVPPLPLVSFLAEVAEALDFLHANGIAHRRLKPANLLRRKGHARVDFGMPHAPSPDGAVFVGLPVYYIAPEQWQNLSASRFTDQYALARIYHEARSGRWNAPTNVLDFLRQALQGPGPDLSGVPEAEQRVLRRALAREPERRYPSCRALMRALAAALAPGCVPPVGAAGRETRATLATRWCGWKDGTVVKLARAIAEADQFEDLPILGDALEDAGCTDEAILAHCRGPGPHVRGCWVLALLLGKG
jgi:hypothetical protein